MTKDEALQMCLEYIETDAHERKYVRHAIKEALAQPAQEPDACCAECGKKKSDGWALYCVKCVEDTPAKRPWIGLTDEEIVKIISSNNSTGLWQIAIQIESALKSKNT
jgi:hypothetical protein